VLSNFSMAITWVPPAKGENAGENAKRIQGDRRGKRSDERDGSLEDSLEDTSSATGRDEDSYRVIDPSDTVGE